MSLEIPKIDNRDYKEILAEAMARIPVHNPEWTNFNNSDPGVTIIQLFAFMTENLVYRSSLIPERNHIKFLKLLGSPVQPASAAEGIVTFSNLNGALKSTTLSPHMKVEAGRVPFRTLDGIDVLPVEASIYYKKTVTKDEMTQQSGELYTELYSGFSETQSQETKFYETRQLEAPLVGVDYDEVDLGNPSQVLDGYLWVAVLARPKASVLQTRKQLANKILTLGILPTLTEPEAKVLPAGTAGTSVKPELEFRIPKPATFVQGEEHAPPEYRLLDADVSGDLFTEPGVVHLTLPDEDSLKLWENMEPLEAGTGDFPPSIDDRDISDRLVTWVRIGPTVQTLRTASNSSTGLKARFSWVNINASRVEQLVHTASENLGTGTGEPDQKFVLKNTPVIPDSVEITINGESWQRTDDLMTAAPEVPNSLTTTIDTGNVNVFTVDRESGEVQFGDGLRGSRPPAAAIIRASYDWGGGSKGNVGIDALNKSASLTNGIKVTNPVPTWGGAEAETTLEAEKQIAGYLRHRDRLVTVEDFREILWRTPSIQLGRAEILPLFRPGKGDVSSPGVVTILAIPAEHAIYPDTPEPDLLFLDAICNYLDPRRLVTTELHVRGPQYVPVWVSVGIDVVPGNDIPPVREAVKQAISEFLSALTGGFDGTGWPLEKSVEKYELWAKAAQVEGVAKVNSVLLQQGEQSASDEVEITGLQLPRLMPLSVQSGDPLPLDLVKADAGSQGQTKTEEPTVFPVPVILPECQ